MIQMANEQQLIDLARRLIAIHQEWNCMGILRNSTEAISAAYTVLSGQEYRRSQVEGMIHRALADSEAQVWRFNLEYAAAND